MTVTVDVQWALHGKTPGPGGARVLACSSGDLSTDNFTELIGRFGIGTPDDLPQVSVGWLQSYSSSLRAYYVGMAIHNWAADVQTDGDKLLERDDAGRPIAVTACFWVPYQPLADAAVSYLDMYHELSGIRLATTSGPPLKVEFPVRAAPPATGPLAVQSAARLLTGQAVCVLDARTATVTDRLEFIDAVATMLPYGFRTRLAAATWVRPTHRNHRFRLFFSSAKRDSSPPDDVVYWGHPERTALTPTDDYAYAYDRWLSDIIHQPYASLARLTAPRSFVRDEVLRSLDEINLHGQKRGKKARRTTDPDTVTPDAGPPEEPSTRAAEPSVEQTLREFISCLQPVNVPKLNTAIIRLQALDKRAISAEERERCRVLIKEHHLFRHGEAPVTIEGRLRDALFKIAFDPPLSYQDYCLIEDSVGSEPPDLELLQMIMDAKMADGRIQAVIYGQLIRYQGQLDLSNWHTSRQVTAVELVVELINAVAGRWDRDGHALNASLTAAEFAKQVNCDPLRLRDVLQRHHYLVHLLQTVAHDSDQLQVYVLYRLIRTAYPDGFSWSDLDQILLKNPDPPSPALLVSLLLQPGPQKSPELTRMIREAYLSRTTLTMALDQSILKSLKASFPFSEGWPARRQPGTGTPPETTAGQDSS